MGSLYQGESTQTLGIDFSLEQPRPLYRNLEQFLEDVWHILYLLGLRESVGNNIELITEVI